MKIQSLIKAFRLRTLPISLSGVILAFFLSYSSNFNWIIFLLVIATTLLLQILSNLANDYGDFKKGTDNDNRLGPERSMQQGLISINQMKKIIAINIVLALCFGLFLIFYSFQEMNIYTFFFIVLGVFGIVSAIKYTMGKYNYGYYGLGDLFVFFFFGMVSVLGTSFLLTNEIHLIFMLPAGAIGFFSVAVLNLNNLRDHINDKKFNKKTLIVRIGFENGKIYHILLCLLPFILIVFFSIISKKYLTLISLIVLPIVMFHLYKVMRNKNPKLLDPELKKIAITTLIFSILCGTGYLFSCPF